MIELYYSFSCSEEYACPVFVARINGIQYHCLFDTGANIGVACTKLASKLFYKTSGCKDLGTKLLSGFGVGVKTRDIRSIPCFKLRDFRKRSGDPDGSYGLSYYDLPFVIDVRGDWGFDFVLPSSMFRFCDVNISYTNLELYIRSSKHVFKGSYNTAKEYAYVKCVK